MAVGQEIQVIYYPIREDMARRAKEMNSFSGYIEGTATAEYRRCVDQAVEAAKHQKEKVDPIYHGKIDALVDTYARKLADNMNRRFEIDARVPSVMVAGPANFPTGNVPPSPRGPSLRCRAFWIRSRVRAWEASVQTIPMRLNSWSRS